jgi:hypothetical protein
MRGLMATPKLRGRFRDHPLAEAFAAEVKRVHLRYARDVVAAYGLCPHLKDPETGFGIFTVVLDERLDVELVESIVQENRTEMANGTLAHIVYPLFRTPISTWDEFASSVAPRVRKLWRGAPVMAAFHPDLPGDPSTAHRMVGMLRHAPDPFVQFVPEGLHEGGTVFSEVLIEMPPDNSQRNFEKLRYGKIDEVVKRLAEVRAERDRAYAPFVAAFRDVS